MEKCQTNCQQIICNITHHNVLHNSLKYHLLKDVLDKNETGVVFKDHLLEMRKVLEANIVLGFMHDSRLPAHNKRSSI